MWTDIIARGRVALHPDVARTYSNVASSSPADVANVLHPSARAHRVTIKAPFRCLISSCKQLPAPSPPSYPAITTMFGCLVAGRLPQTNLQQIDETRAVFEIPAATTVNHICVFLLGSGASQCCSVTNPILTSIPSAISRWLRCDRPLLLARERLSTSRNVSFRCPRLITLPRAATRSPDRMPPCSGFRMTSHQRYSASAAHSQLKPQTCTPPLLEVRVLTRTSPRMSGSPSSRSTRSRSKSQGFRAPSSSLERI